MSAADDILFEPIGKTTPKTSTNGLIDQQMIDAIKIALTGASAIEFFIDPKIAFDTYDLAADVIEHDKSVIRYTRQMVLHNPLGLIKPGRPAGALTIKDVFRRIHQGEDEFWFCAHINGNGIRKQKFVNWFSVDSKIPVLALDGGNGNCNFFEWWIVGVMRDFLGYQGYYAFATEADARKYYALP